MLFWFSIALMTTAAVLAVLWPLAYRREPVPSRDAELAVYRDQLAEIERDRVRGLIAGEEAEAARIEVSRRLLAAASAPEPSLRPSLRRRRATAVLALAGIPMLSLGLYLGLGSPELPGATLAARLAKPAEQQELSILVQRIEQHLAQNPDDARGWELLAPVYLRIGRAADAVKARANVLRLQGSNADREADLGEALVAAANGVVTAEAAAAFTRAVAQEREHPKANFFLALAAEQDGRREQAIDRWRRMLETATPDDPWAVAARDRLERARGGRP